MKKITLLAAVLTALSPITMAGPAVSALAPAADPVQIMARPDYQAFRDPDNLSIDLIVSPGETAVNAFDMTLRFEPDMLLATGLVFPETDDEIIMFEEIENQDGSVRIAGGVVNAGIGTTTAIVRIIFIKLKSGWTSLDFPSVEILAADGLGTSLPVLPETHNLLIIR
jgi:hypothetical protein